MAGTNMRLQRLMFPGLFSPCPVSQKLPVILRGSFSPDGLTDAAITSWQASSRPGTHRPRHGGNKKASRLAPRVAG